VSRPPRALLPRSAVPVAVAAFVGLAACADEPTGTSVDASFVPVDYLITNGFEFTSTVDGVRNAEVEADSAWQWQDSTATHLFGVQMDFFDTLGLPTARLTAQFARLNAETQDLVARGNAVLTVRARNARIQSPVLYYYPDQDEIRSDTVTRALIDGDLLTGTRFVSDLQFQNISIDSPVGDIPDLLTDTVATGGATGPSGGGREGTR